MTRSVFGWSLPPGVTQSMIDGPPEPPMPCDPNYPRCACGALLTLEPEPPGDRPTSPACRKHGTDYAACDAALDAMVNIEERYYGRDDLTDEQEAECKRAREAAAGCDGPSYVSYEYRTCKRCGAVTREMV